MGKILEEDVDYVLKHDKVWITVRNLSVGVHTTDEGVVVDIYALNDKTGEPLATTYAFFDEGTEEEKDEIVQIGCPIYAAPSSRRHHGERMNGHTQVFFFDEGRFAILREGGDDTKENPYRQRIIDHDFMEEAEAASLYCQNVRRELLEHCPCLACSIVKARRRYAEEQEMMEKIKVLLGIPDSIWDQKKLVEKLGKDKK